MVLSQQADVDGLVEGVRGLQPGGIDIGVFGREMDHRFDAGEGLAPGRTGFGEIALDESKLRPGFGREEGRIGLQVEPDDCACTRRSRASDSMILRPRLPQAPVTRTEEGWDEGMAQVGLIRNSWLSGRVCPPSTMMVVPVI